ncbi:MAG: ribonuclease P protein component [Candidatus Omnitrophota bacterium]|jgi:ribonuclease P protein component
MKRFSLSRPERITKTSDFKQALKNGSFYNGRALKLSISRNDRGVSRIGVSLRKHIFKLAVSRNKLRRHIKEAFRLNKEKLEKGYDIVAIPRAAAADLKYEELNSEFLALLKKAGISKD